MDRWNQTDNFNVSFIHGLSNGQAHIMGDWARNLEYYPPLLTSLWTQNDDVHCGISCGLSELTTHNKYVLRFPQYLKCSSRLTMPTNIGWAIHWKSHVCAELHTLQIYRCHVLFNSIRLVLRWVVLHMFWQFFWYNHLAHSLKKRKRSLGLYYTKTMDDTRHLMEGSQLDTLYQIGLPSVFGGATNICTAICGTTKYWRWRQLQNAQIGKVDHGAVIGCSASHSIEVQ